LVKYFLSFLVERRLVNSMSWSIILFHSNLSGLDRRHFKAGWWRAKRSKRSKTNCIRIKIFHGRTYRWMISIATIKTCKLMIVNKLIKDWDKGSISKVSELHWASAYSAHVSINGCSDFRSQGTKGLPFLFCKALPKQWVVPRVTHVIRLRKDTVWRIPSPIFIK